MPERASLLMYAIRIPVICKYVAQLILVQVGLILFPFCLALFYAEYALALRFFTMACLLMLIALPLLHLPAPVYVQTNEALTITVIVFLIGAAAMVYPFMGAGLPFLDALFEAVSGITTTGLSTVAELENKPKSFLFARALMQWYGGLGFVVLAITLVMGQQSASRRLLGQEFEYDNIVVGIRSHARQVTLVYLLLTFIPAVLLYFWGVGSFTSIVHVLSAVSTGGFSSFNDNLAGLDSWSIQLFLSCVGLLGAISLALYYRLYQYGFSKQTSLTETLVLLLMVISATTILALIMFLNNNMDWFTSIQRALLLAISAQTTTGFNSFNTATLEPIAKTVIMLSMAVGGDIGSTAGGFKVLRFLILLKLMQFTIQRRAMADHAVCEPQLAGNAITTEEITGVLSLLGWFIALIFCSWLPFVGMGHNPLDALFEVVSATATVGLSSGITQTELQPALKLILCFDMLAGRLEIIALIVYLYPKTWVGRRREE